MKLPGREILTGIPTVVVMRTAMNIAHLCSILIFMSAVIGCGSSPRTTNEQLRGYVPCEPTGFASAIFRKASAEHAGRWVLLLPGASGLVTFGDSEHYFKSADSIAAAGFDVLVVDYKLAHKRGTGAPGGHAGAKIAWVIAEVVAKARATGLIRSGEPGAIVAWSLGAEGLWPIVVDAGSPSPLVLKAAAAYYPSHEHVTSIRSSIPLLLLNGELDDVTPARELRTATSNPPSPLVQVQCYPGAHHGFDIDSLVPPRRVSLIPLIGPSATFGYDAPAATDSQRRLIEFLDANVRTW